MNTKKKINLTLSKKSESQINTFMTMLDKTLVLRRKYKKNISYKQNLKENLKIFLSNQFQPKMMKGLK
jgi:hypothetical protein